VTTLSEEAIFEKIKNRDIFTATIDGGGFTLKIDNYEPAMSAAIHDGGNLRSALVDNCLLSQAERYYEEDPHTASFIAQQAITLVAHDSRYEYDLNRDTDTCVYETAWGKECWKKPQSEEMIAASKAKHAQFYRMVSAVVEALVEDFGQCIVYDNHSYNYRRHERTDLPVFNLGTSSVKSEKWRPVINYWLDMLKNMKVDGVDVTAAENDIFQGKGYLAAYCHGLYDDVLVLATESKKVFMNELTGESEPQVLPSLQQAYNQSVKDNTTVFIKKNIHS